ncbi:hypothetical protein COX95_01665 [bacterium CG_4_10_14_0_2_um_filter_33_32]|nr:MAG: hypothetical protein AUJ93_03555 [bacterium CG2_30_33_46]PIY85393.1 MAG: hypothetical protein COY76_02450 [bacterium CG_4_10_14_0_8_um_filter_33_57]PIZ86336.1 MAG: hypothetical protein COX95_01665 [bacterium CG_4_10_14_0_2_um_filter_33_32]PJA72182.1 MAG: hypothetical protein CO152_02840 [bacterium CG_4_9_14_3_um_filter_33_26]
MDKKDNLNNVTDLRENKDTLIEKNTEQVVTNKKPLPWKRIIALGFAFILVSNIIFALGVYKFSWHDSITRTVLRVVPYPAVLVKSRIITIGQYHKDLDSYKNYYKVGQKADFSSEEGQKLFKTLKEDLLNQLIEEKIIQAEAKKMNIKVSKTEIGDEYKKLVEVNGEDTLKKQIKDYYNWDMSTFKAKIGLKILRNKVEEKIKKDDIANKKSKVDELLKKVKGGEDFAKVAKENSEDQSSAEGGNLGWVSKGKYAQEFEDAAFSLKPGEISNVVETIDGLNIIKVNDKKENEVLVSRILIKTITLDEWLKQKKTEYKIRTLIDINKINP